MVTPALAEQSSSTPPSDAPPSYDAILEKIRGFNDDKSPPQASSSSHTVPPPVTLDLAKKPKGKPSSAVGNSWFGGYDVASEIRNTTQGLLREIVQSLGPDTDLPSVLGIISSCEGACETNDVSFSDIIQGPFIEGHSPLYWVIVKGFPGVHPDSVHQPDLLSAFLFYATSLQEATRTEIRRACLETSNQNIFSRLRGFPGFATMFPTDGLLLGVKTPVDEIEVVECTTVEHAFAVNFVIPQFQKRMAVSKGVVLEFITQGMLVINAIYVSNTHLFLSLFFSKRSFVVLSVLDVNRGRYLQRYTGGYVMRLPPHSGI